MNLPLVVMPDVEQVACDYLRTISQVTTFVGTRIGTRAPDPLVYPYATLHRVGGGEVVEFVTDRAVIDYSVWAATRGEASDTFRTIRAALKAARGYQHRLAVVTNVEELVGVSWLPDSDRIPPTARFVGSMAITVRPNL